MGGLISKPINYIKTKVEDTKVAIRTRVDNTKNAIWNFIYGIHNGIVTRVTNTKNAVVSFKNGVVNGVIETKNGIVGGVVRTKDGVVGGVSNAVTGVTNRVRRVKDGVTESVRTKKNRIRGWSKKRRILYGFFCVLFLMLAIPLSLISWDLYHGNYKGAKNKWNQIEQSTFFMGSVTKSVTMKTAKGVSNLIYYTGRFTAFISKHLLNISEWLSKNMLSGAIAAGKEVAHWTGVVFDFAYRGSCSAGIIIWDGSAFIASKFGSATHIIAESVAVAFAFTMSWTGDAFSVIYKWTSVSGSTVFSWFYTYGLIATDWLMFVCVTLFQWSCVFMRFTFSALASVLSFLYSALVVVSDFVYRWSGISFPFIIRWIYKCIAYIAETIYTAIPKASRAVYVAVNKHVLQWIWLGIGYIIDYICVAFYIIGKFLQDVAIYFGNFLYLAGQHIMKVVYILYSFLYSIFGVFTGAVKGVLQGAVSVVTAMFSAVIWFLEETIFAYLYMLHQYNIYRELLFLLFLILVSVYCTGLIRDTKDMEGDSEESGSDSEHRSIDTFDAGSSSKQTQGQPPPYSASKTNASSNKYSDDDSDLDIELPDELPDAFESSESELDFPDSTETTPAVDFTEEDLPSEEFPDFSEEEKADEPGLFERLRNIKFRKSGSRDPQEADNTLQVPDINEYETDEDILGEEELIPDNGMQVVPDANSDTSSTRAKGSADDLIPDTAPTGMSDLEKESEDDLDLDITEVPDVEEDVKDNQPGSGTFVSAHNITLGTPHTDFLNAGHSDNIPGIPENSGLSQQYSPMPEVNTGSRPLSGAGTTPR